MTTPSTIPDPAGPNAWMIDEMFERYAEHPANVSPEWQEYFSALGATRTALAPERLEPVLASRGPAATAPSELPRRSDAGASNSPTSTPPATNGSNGATPNAQPIAPQATRTATAGQPATEAPSQPAAAEPGEPLRGVAARIVDNMESSLEVPTATSVREVPTKLLEVNRRVLNNYLRRSRRGKVSYTHLIGYAVVRAVRDAVPAMNASFARGGDDKPRLLRHDHIGIGIAVDLENPDGSRSLLVPCVKDCQDRDFRSFVDAYEQLVAKVRAKKLSPDDFSGTTITLTNPGTIGTMQSVPRLMNGQGLIVGVGRMGYPASFAGADPATIAEIGLSRVMSLTSTYDHRIIQGAESGLFLKYVHELLMGDHGFYEDVFRSFDVPYSAVQWLPDVTPLSSEDALVEKQMAVSTVVNMHRVLGHRIAVLDPLRVSEPDMPAELDPATYGLTIWDLDREFRTGTRHGVYAPVGGTDRMTLGNLLGVLRDAYCRTVGIEYMHIQDPTQKRWIQEQVEGVDTAMGADDQLHILDRLNAAEAFEKFLATKYVGQKRFGIEGAESAVPILDAILEAAADDGMDSAVLGMAHRGRLNVLVNIMGKSHVELLGEFEGHVNEHSVQGSGDVKYHLGQEGTFISRSGNELPIELAANPSHLEAVDPVVVGMARARMDQIETRGDYPVLPVLMHGDAAFAGQGVVAETLNLSGIKGYRVGGTVHVVVNNQLGFTTTPDAARTSEYSTDVAKMVQAPIFHVNGDDPEACVRVARLAFAFRQRFNTDVVIDMVCYRRHGHNEGDDPSYTQPLMYRAIDGLASVRELYTDALLSSGDLSLEMAELARADFEAKLQAALEQTRSDAPPAGTLAKEPPPAVGVLPHIETGIGQRLERLFSQLDTVPADFNPHPKLAKQLAARRKMFEDGEVDWALAESLAFASLLTDGVPVRLSGQDSRRGTFSQRHSVLVDHEHGTEFVPLANLADDQANLWIYDSLLSEYAALGFEYGYSVRNKDALVMWEAQFGDFVNGAQITIDQFIVAAEDKWNQTSGLVMLLPHGMEGQGPEHSSARLERFLILAAEDNIQIVNATTAAQYFHLLRRQVVRDIRKPLIVFTPKSKLRAKDSRSLRTELETGSFQELLPDPGVDPGSVRRIVFCSGKIGLEALAERDKRSAPVAIARVEQLFPWPTADVAAFITRHSNAREIIWLQEEPENMGAWNFAKGHLFEPFDATHSIQRISRVGSGSPATGSNTIHRQEHAELLDRVFDV